MLQSLIRNFGFTEVTPSRNRKERRCFLLLFARLFVTLHQILIRTRNHNDYLFQNTVRQRDCHQVRP